MYNALFVITGAQVRHALTRDHHFTAADMFMHKCSEPNLHVPPVTEHLNIFTGWCLLGNGIVWMVTGQLADMPTRGLDDSRTGHLADWTNRGLNNSRMPPASLCA